jgi:hypothetical protein
MDIITINGYDIAGNEHVAVAINTNDPADAHHFTRDPDCHDSAFARAVAWTNPGVLAEE